MKKLILLSLTLACLTLTAQSVPCNIAGNFTATGDSLILDNTKLGCYQWRIAYSSTGFSALSISLQTATTAGGSYSDYTGATVVTDGSNPSTTTTHAIIGIHANGAFVKLRLGSVTGSGTIIYQVWGANSTSSSGALTGTSPIVVAGNNVSCPTCGTSSGSVTSVGTTAPLTGGPITTTGTVACATCVTSASALTNNNFVFGAGSQGSQTVSAATATAALNLFSSTLQGLAPLSGGGTTNFLRADGAWAAPPGGGGSGALIKLSQTILGVDTATVTFSAIVGTYTDLVISVMGRSSATAQNDSVLVQYNGDTANNYDQQELRGVTSAATAGNNVAGGSAFLGFIPAATATAGFAGTIQSVISSYSGTTFFKEAITTNGTIDTTIVTRVEAIWHQWRSTTAITSILIFLPSANFKAGSSFTLYGKT